MNGHVIYGTSSDTRVRACGISISGEEFAVIRPFIHAASELQGNFTFEVSKLSSSGRSSTRQQNRFSTGTLDNAEVVVDRSGRARIALAVTDETGNQLCNVDQIIELEQTPTPI
ncbi:curli-like amyloid fiber formation chaperone CsgH [Shinella sp.]|nr:curli-like amyloid fiber formation chaperone CsgH [Shinella sp.]